MSSFRTTIPAFLPAYQLDHHDEVLSMGSCFAVNMADKLTYYKFKNIANSFGILYHPLNIHDTIIKALEAYSYSQDDLVERDGYYYSWWHHSQCHHKKADPLLKDIQTIQADLLDKIKTCKLFIFTFGTAYFYQHNDTGILVGNCHKVPANEFNKQLATVEEIAASYQVLLKKILVINPEAKFLFTVSPIRHLKDGMIENNRSKATLHLAISAITQALEEASYFPAYEIMMDDLRDYRFYKADLLHPNEMAVSYIWQQFSSHLFSEQTHRINATIKSLQDALAHRPFNIESSAHQAFLKNTLNKLRENQSEYNFLNFSQEIKSLEDQII